MDFVEKIKVPKKKAAARLITLVEKRDPEAIRARQQIYPQCGRAHLIGITGPPGVGKSCMVTAHRRGLFFDIPGPRAVTIQLLPTPGGPVTPIKWALPHWG